MDSYAFKVRYISRAGSLYVHVRACGETMLSWVRVRMAWPVCIYTCIYMAMATQFAK